MQDGPEQSGEDTRPAARVVAKPERKPISSGMRCPVCDCCDLRAWATRRRAERIVRVRVCRNCGERVTTVERLID